MPTRKRVPDEVDITILTMMKAYPPASYRQVAEAVSRSIAAISTRVTWLKEMGYLQQAPNTNPGDARSLILSEKGFRAVG